MLSVCAGRDGREDDTSVSLHGVALAHVPLRQRRPRVPETRARGRRLDPEERSGANGRALQVSSMCFTFNEEISVFLII